jgi:DNA-binding transcriptional LysR family regulator
MEQHSNAFTIDIRRLRVLRELRSRGTIGATAGALHLTPSAVSQQIASLGREVGVPLLTPQGRGVRLTKQAELLLQHGAAVDAQLERARADLAAFNQGTVGQVAIGAFATAITGFVVSALERLRRERPQLRLALHEIEAPQCFTSLDRGELDLVITVDHRGGPHRGDPRYARQDLLDDPLLVALPELHPLAPRRSVDLLLLADQPWIVGAVHGPCQETGLAACAAAGFSPQVVHQVNDWGALLELVAAGCGVGLVPRLAIPASSPVGVVLRPPSGPHHPSRHIYAAVRAGAERSPQLAPVLVALADTARRRRSTRPS